jgi:hypothetical protein
MECISMAIPEQAVANNVSGISRANVLFHGSAGKDTAQHVAASQHAAQSTLAR